MFREMRRKKQMTGVWLSFPITECFVTLTGIALYIKSERGKKNV